MTIQELLEVLQAYIQANLDYFGNLDKASPNDFAEYIRLCDYDKEVCLDFPEYG